MKKQVRKLKNWSWMLMLAYMLGIAKPYREEETVLSLVEVRLDERDPTNDPPIGIKQWTFEEATFYHETGFDYFPRN